MGRLTTVDNAEPWYGVLGGVISPSDSSSELSTLLAAVTSAKLKESAIASCSSSSGLMPETW